MRVLWVRPQAELPTGAGGSRAGGDPGGRAAAGDAAGGDAARGGRADPVALLAGDLRPPPSGRPWVIATMVTSADGSAVDRSGVSGGLGGAGDRAMFAALRAVADVIIAGAATVVAEDYGPSRPSAAVRRQRIARGQPATPRMAVLTSSLGLDPAQRLFAEATADAIRWQPGHQ